MSLPQDHPFMKIYEKLETREAWLLSQLKAYESQHQKYLLIQERLTDQERSEIAADLYELRVMLEELGENLCRIYDHFEALLKRVWDSQVQEALDGIDAELQQLWNDRRQS
jgi:predicted metal-dependent hydrolase